MSRTHLMSKYMFNPPHIVISNLTSVDSVMMLNEVVGAVLITTTYMKNVSMYVYTKHDYSA